MSRLALFLALPLAAQTVPAPQAPKPNRTFTVDAVVRHTPVTSQDSSGTCWAFATTSFMEAELIRLGKGEIGLSEMAVARNTWPRKAWHHFRLQGVAPWSPGGQAHDWVDTVQQSGLVPREAYNGLKPGETRHNHGEMDAVTRGFMEALARQKQPSSKWPAALEGVWDAYIGRVPATFTFQGKTWTPASFRDHLALPLDQYVELTSFTHHPFYKPFRLEIQDNFAMNAGYYNLPLEELEQVMEASLQKGYTFVWDGDVSESTFSQKTLGYAWLAPEPVPGEEAPKPEPGRPEVEGEVTQASRQTLFDSFKTTDDHLMHIVGLSHDQAGNRFFITKNSWGPKNGPEKGLVHMSRAYVRAKTVAIMVHRDALPKAIRQKLGL